ncbi:MAG: HU family DNA-binding protein [Firmicutes bacterium]|nr:HU family DNA-binding protein [Clostridiales bacterium]MBQ3122900.1 HU family DNA-binding protein [Bacillota bacterium]
MNKKELIKELSNKNGLTRKDNELVLESLIETIYEVLAEGDKVHIAGLGSFSSRKRDERTMVNPRTGKEVTVTESVVPSFKAGKKLKDALK